jgi:hypothetical protein
MTNNTGYHGEIVGNLPLLRILKYELRTSKPRKRVNFAFIDVRDRLLKEVETYGIINLDPEFSNDLGYLLRSAAEIRITCRCSEATISFIQGFFREAGRVTALNIEDVNRMLISSLYRDEGYFRVSIKGARSYLESTGRGVRKIGARVRLELKNPERWEGTCEWA